MGLFFPDIVSHNNPDRALIDSNFVRGSGRVVADLVELYGLYADKFDQMKQFVTIVYVESENASYLFIDENEADNSDGWLIFGSGSGTTTMADMTDVNITAADDGQILIYDLNSAKWINSSLLRDNTSVTSLNFQLRLMYDFFGEVSTDWSNRTMMNAMGDIVFDWNDYTASDSGTVQSINWDTRYLIDSLNVVSINWNSRELINSNKTALDWANRITKDTLNVTSIDWENRSLWSQDATSKMTWNNNGVILLHHLAVQGISPNVSVLAGAGQNAAIVPLSTYGTDTAGSITFTCGNGMAPDQPLIDVPFVNSFIKPVIFLSTETSVVSPFYVINKGVANFQISTAAALNALQDYTIYYHVIDIIT